jgi:DNA-binding GntR family transcriptional regulator
VDGAVNAESAERRNLDAEDLILMSYVRRGVTRATLSDQLEGALREEILTGHLPPGTRLRTEEVAARYGVSHTPIREALQRLAGESLVSIGPGTGAVIAPISLEELRDVHRLRVLLEREALRESIELGDAAWEAGLRAATSALTTALTRRRAPASGDRQEARSEAHRAFDRALFAACRSAWLLRFVETMSAHWERYRVLLRAVRGLERDLVHEHQAIADAALRRNIPAATDLLEAHLGLTLSLIESEFAGSSAASAAGVGAGSPGTSPRASGPSRG